MREIPADIQEQIEKIRQKCSQIKPCVVIHSLAYNHGPYIREALEGFVNQRTDFSIVAVVHDDASTDNTAVILREYAERYPDIILPIFESENQYSNPEGWLGEVMKLAMEVSGALYIAMCECDDYWTDPLKLQKQVDFLKSHPDYSMCFHGVEVTNESVKSTSLACNNIQSREYYSKEILTKWIVPTCSMVMRRECILKLNQDEKYIVGDNVILANCISLGKIWGEETHMGVYRRNITSWTVRNSSSHNAYTNEFRWIEHYEAMRKNFPTIDKKIFDMLIMRKMAGITIHDIKNKKKNFRMNFANFFKQYKYKYIYYIIYNIINKCL